MDNETTKKSMLDEEYIPIYQKRLGDAVTFAKGNMSMAEFAQKRDAMKQQLETLYGGGTL